jgi:ATP-binding cassette subfamily B multidrug efflux pump
MKLVRLWGLFFPLVALLSGATTVILLMLGGPQVIGGQLDPGGFSALLIYLGMLVWPMISVGFTFNMLQRGAASMARVNEVLKLDPEIPNPEQGASEVKDYGIRIQGLNFSYAEELGAALTDISLEVKPGERLGILGPTGSGKSTLTEILCRFLDPPPGTVFLGGKDIRDYQLPTLRRQFALVPQNPFLFSMSIKENIGFGSDDPKEEDLWRMAELSTITRDLETFPQGWETLVGEKGVTLSGRAETTADASPGPGGQSPHPDPRRQPQRCGLGDRREDPQTLTRDKAGSDHHPHQPPDRDLAKMRPDCGD